MLNAVDGSWPEPCRLPEPKAAAALGPNAAGWCRCRDAPALVHRCDRLTEPPRACPKRPCHERDNLHNAAQPRLNLSPRFEPPFHCDMSSRATDPKSALLRCPTYSTRLRISLSARRRSASWPKSADSVPARHGRRPRTVAEIRASVVVALLFRRQPVLLRLPEKRAHRHRQEPCRPCLVPVRHLERLPDARD